jgi:CBS domain-containing protein
MVGGDIVATMDAATEFTALFNELDDYLRRALRIDRPWDFMNLVNEAVRRGIVHRGVVGELHDCKNLRNLLVHTSRYPHEAYAEPSAWGLQRFREVVEEIVHPVRLLPTFKRDLRVFTPNQALVEALHHLDEKDYSQVVVRVDGERYALLTLEGVARWLASTTKDGVAQVGAATIAEALAYEPKGTCKFLPGDGTLEDARKAFELPRRPGGPRPRARVFAAIITEHGDERETPLGIVTAGDLIDGYAE